MPSEATAEADRWRGAVGVTVGHGFAPLADSVALAREAERAGLDFVSIGDSGSETFSLLGAIAQTTQRVELLSGIAQWTRSPATLSHAAQTVQNLSRGRYCLGIGPMPRHWCEDWHGLEHEPAGSRMRDYVAATRAALCATPEAPTAHEGRFFRTVGYPGRMMTPARSVPIHVAASRPRMTEIAAEIADGVLFNTIQPLEWLAGEGREAVERGLATAARPREEFSVGVMRFCGIDKDRERAYEHARRGVAFYFAIPYFRALLEPLGFSAELDAGEAALARGDLDGQVAAVSDRLVEAVAFAGTPGEVAEQLRATQEHVDYVVLAAIAGQSRAAAAEQTVRLIETFAPASRLASRARRQGHAHRRTSIHRGFVDTAYGQVHYRERGAGRPVILLHQTASSSVQWERVMERFKPGSRLLAMDTPGFGDSAPAAQKPDGLAWYADRVADFMAGHAIDRAAIVGHHTGAMIAAELAIRRPELVERLALVGCVVMDEPERRAAIEEIHRWELDSAGRFLEEYLMPRLRLSVTTDDPEHLRRELIAYLQAGPDYAWAYEAVFSYPGPERLPGITVPTVCVLPIHEPERLCRWTEAAATIIPGAELVRLDGGTEVCFQQPDVLAAALDLFVSTPGPNGAR